MYNHLKGLFVSPETTIYFITGDTSSTDAAAKINEVGPVLSLIGEAGWSVSNVTTPETDPGLRAVLSEIAQRTSGESFELSIPHGLEEIANRTLIREGKGPLQPMGDTTAVARLDIRDGPGRCARHGRAEPDLLP